jgi:Raf kinase inhibitor-like YbhB/YbcL family protein
VDPTRVTRFARPARRLAAAGVALGCALPLTGCDLFGSDITISSPSVMTVSSGAFEQDVMPQRYTCDNPRTLSPPLGWAGAPSGTKSIALVVDDSSAPITPYVYWIVFDINPATSDIQEGQLPLGARQAQNSAGQASYDPPCPGKGGHTYRFTVYALNTVLNLPNGTSLQSAWTAIAAATIGRGRLPPIRATS